MKNKRRKQIKLRNKNLLKKYPFLTPVDWFGRKISPREHKYEWTMLDDMPVGWKRAFGYFLVEDIKNALKINNTPLGGLLFVQVKEKYGELRIYTYGGNRDVDRVIDDYSVISRNICFSCGKPDVSIIKKGWILPMCEKCYNNLLCCTTYSDAVGNETDCKIPDTYEICRYSNGKTEKIKISIKDKADKIRKKYYKTHKEN